MNIDEYCPKQYIILHGQQPGDIIFRHFYLPNDTWCNKFKPNFGTHQYFSENDDTRIYCTIIFYWKRNSLKIKSTKQTLEKTEVAFKSGQSRDTDNIVYTRRRQTKHKNTTHKTKIGPHQMPRVIMNR
jgi:hypothetical protein